MSLDTLNLLVLLIGVGMTANHARATWRARSSAGASILSTAFFTAMAAWQATYMATLAQWASCAGLAALFAAHALWLGLQIRFRLSAPKRTATTRPSILELMQ
jgi:Na+-transporting NADH:ubiquinone oxidoreductase subunit NqrB